MKTHEHASFSGFENWKYASRQTTMHESPPGNQLPDSYVLFSRKKKPSGKKSEIRKGKLPNQIRHDENASIAIGTWKKRSKKKEK